MTKYSGDSHEVKNPPRQKRQSIVMMIIKLAIFLAVVALILHVLGVVNLGLPFFNRF